MARDHEELGAVQKDLKRKQREAKNKYRKKMELRMGQNYTKEVWNGMKWMTGCNNLSPEFRGPRI